VVRRGDTVAILVVEPTGWASWNVLIKSGGSPITELKISAWKSRGSFQLDGQDFTIEPTGFWLQNATLQRGGAVVARAEKPSLFRRQFLITSAGYRLEMESRSWTGREYALMVGHQEVGRVSREGMLGRKISLELPVEVPEVIQVFLTYLVLCQAKRETAAAAAGS
jgi:hypothetical protein